MTGLYDWNPMPHVLAVRCRTCRRLASFEFAESVWLRSRADIDFFRDSDQFDCVTLTDQVGQRRPAALFFPGLHGGGTAAIRELPAYYAPSDWDHSPYLYRRHGLDLGSLCCTYCGARDVVTLSWPADAYYQITHRGAVLWAFHRESAVELRRYVASSDRRKAGYRWGMFLRHVPAPFLRASARAAVVRKLDRLLDDR